MKLRHILFVILCVCCVACTLPDATIISTEPEPTSVPIRPTVTPIRNITIWETIMPGLEHRVYNYNTDDRTQILVVRIDPEFFTFRTHYEPGVIRNLLEWQETLPQATAIINANFFQPDFTTLGLTVVDGIVYGVPYLDRGGMFYVQGDQPAIRSNVDQPYVGEPLQQAIQAWPMLVQNGVQAYTAQSRSARRTAIGMDFQGRVLLIVTSRGSVTLAGLSAFLTESDMNISNAFNLDGGGSTMLSINTTGTQQTVGTFDSVPVVLAVYAR